MSPYIGKERVEKEQRASSYRVQEFRERYYGTSLLKKVIAW